MTEEQFEALKRWIETAAQVEAMKLDGGGMHLTELESRLEEAERDARDAFCGKTWEQPHGR